MSTPDDNVPDGLLPADMLASTTPVAVYGYARAKPGKEDEFERLVRSIIPSIRAEWGYEQYTVHTSKDEPGAFAFYERWTSGADLLRHVRQPFMQDYFGRLPALLATDLEATWIWPLDA
ncbi:putative quinol monooxygenase [Dactylosporangium sp. CA-092794]|uniref:putative quinol monooxygenase n=1 Tax=Dactylosporangium sp. CA-092794 TaxID=3239929 RepID=UPI003D926D70